MLEPSVDYNHENKYKQLISLSHLYWAVVLLLRECHSEISYSLFNPNPNFFVLDEMADPGQN